MHYLTIIMLSLLLSMPGSVFARKALENTSKPTPPAKNAESVQKPAEKPAEPIYEFTIAGKNQGKDPKDFVYKMDDVITIKTTGKRADTIKKDLSKPLTLHLNGVAMTNLAPSPEQNELGPEVTIAFHLVRDAQQEESRKAWDTLFTRSKGYEMTIKPALAIGGDIPVSVYSNKTLKFYVATGSAVCWTIIIGLAIFFGVYYLLVTRTNMLHDEGTGCYSLGKSQMAFWGLLVILAFTAVWILTGTMERIPPQTLILLGISGTTGLTAIMIGDSKRSDVKNKLTKLKEEENELLDKEAKHPRSISVTDQSRLAGIPQEINQLNKQLASGQSKGFWRDICDDGKGASFHRFQVVLWTIVLGAVFVRTVAHIMSMPEFSETLLILLGISNATYLGFKIPEKP
jgi:hypothetical protein